MHGWFVVNYKAEKVNLAFPVRIPDYHFNQEIRGQVLPISRIVSESVPMNTKGGVDGLEQVPSTFPG